MHAVAVFRRFQHTKLMRRGNPLELDLAYTRAMMSFQLFQSDPKDILIVGLGGDHCPNTASISFRRHA